MIGPPRWWPGSGRLLQRGPLPELRLGAASPSGCRFGFGRRPLRGIRRKCRVDRSAHRSSDGRDGGVASGNVSRGPLGVVRRSLAEDSASIMDLVILDALLISEFFQVLTLVNLLCLVRNHGEHAKSYTESNHSKAVPPDM